MFNENAAVARLSELFALELGYPPDYARQISIAAALHDVGKKLLDPAIVNKPGKLTPEEFDVMKTHTKLGAQLLSDIPGELGTLIVNVCAFHHEWHNGEGYWGIPTSRLPRYITVVSIADVFCACCAKRSYKDSWPPEQVLEYLKSRVGTQFPSDMVDAFIHLIRNNNDVPAIFATTK